MEVPFSWNDELEAARVQTESYFGVSFNDWLYIHDYITVAQIVAIAKSYRCSQVDGTRQSVIARVDGRVVGYARWLLPESRIHRPGRLSKARKYLMQKKGKIELYFNPVGEVYNMERRGYAVKQHEKAVDSIFGKRKDW